MKSDPPVFSIVVPIHNESDSVEELVSTVEHALLRLDGGYEILLIDDGSTDDTLQKLKRLARFHRHVRVAAFRKNVGKSPALECGFRLAAGEFIATMDADLQDDPSDLPKMYEHLTNEGVDVVSGWRVNRRDSRPKVLSSRLFNLIVRLLFGCSFKDMNSGLKLYRAAAARELHLYGGMHRFIPLILSEMGFRVAEVPVRHQERKYGASKYRSTKILTEIPDLLTLYFLLNYTRRPLHFFGKIGSVLCALGLASLTYLTVLWFRGIPIGTRPLLTFGVLMMVVGAQIVFTGLLADLIVNMDQDRNRDVPLKYVSDQDVPSEGWGRQEHGREWDARTAERRGADR